MSYKFYNIFQNSPIKEINEDKKRPRGYSSSRILQLERERIPGKSPQRARKLDASFLTPFQNFSNLGERNAINDSHLANSLGKNQTEAAAPFLFIQHHKLDQTLRFELSPADLGRQTGPGDQPMLTSLIFRSKDSNSPREPSRRDHPQGHRFAVRQLVT